VNKEQIKFWATFGALLLLGLWIYSRVKKTASDAGTVAQNVYINPLKQLFG